MRLLLIVSLLSAAWPARAQGTPSAEAPTQAAPVQEAPGSPPLSLRRGEQVRIETQGGQRHSGELVGLIPGALELQAGGEEVLSLLLADVQRLEVRKRAVASTAVTGGAVGGLGGALFLALICAVAIEGDPSLLPCVAGGALMGGALGAGAGVVLGLAVPRWSTSYEKEKHGQLVLRLTEPEDDVLAHWFSGEGPIGELGLRLGHARDMRTSEPTARWGGRLHLLALIGPHVAIGPEVAWYGSIVTRTLEPPLFQLGALLRLGTEIGPARASVLGGLGLVDKGSGHAGASVGGELEVLLGKHLPVALEARYHFDLEREGRSDSDSLTLGLGTRVRW